ncbi:MAG: hypothetical protein ACYC2O_08005 [Microthrixaceae bacterium]
MDTDDRTPHPGEHYEIRVDGRLGARWAAWFDGLTLTDADDGTTVLRGPVVDQAALHGLLQQLRDLGLTLLSLTRTTPDEPSDPHRTNTGATP